MMDPLRSRGDVVVSSGTCGGGCCAASGGTGGEGAVMVMAGLSFTSIPSSRVSSLLLLIVTVLLSLLTVLCDKGSFWIGGFAL